MTQAESKAEQTTVAVEALRAALKSQFHAALAMLKLAIERCPDSLWADGEYVNPTWRIAYHALYYTHLYIQPSATDFRPWEHHQTGIQDLDDYPSPPEIQELTELPHRPPQTGEPYTKEDILTYWTICDEMIDAAVDALDLLNPESGFSWYRLPTLEQKLVNLRHIQHHTAQLGNRLREASSGTNGIDWVGAGRHAKRKEFPQ